jgi:hypothetical protein
MFNGNTRAFQAATVWGLSRSNASNIIAQSLPIITVGDSDPLYRFEDTLLTQLDWYRPECGWNLVARSPVT